MTRASRNSVSTGEPLGGTAAATGRHPLIDIAAVLYGFLLFWLGAGAVAFCFYALFFVRTA